jgi:hypothetical protein
MKENADLFRFAPAADPADSKAAHPKDLPLKRLRERENANASCWVSADQSYSTNPNRSVPLRRIDSPFQKNGRKNDITTFQKPPEPLIVESESKAPMPEGLFSYLRFDRT